ncbi:unnamed protein product [Ostreobium quekettii]|uniref:Uncharacterized protein n=1 Tax=Ostreobium quekettii TaxID=121088 RepID=A0A8S1IN64_9CHLO|nr:unnamed protein product [Ostreobium quekettii]|eukprot:evm.model.scf_26.12 EVM.evm.TU.scf_26.12   scf_26:86646-91107(+)
MLSILCVRCQSTKIVWLQGVLQQLDTGHAKPGRQQSRSGKVEASRGSGKGGGKTNGSKGGKTGGNKGRRHHRGSPQIQQNEIKPATCGHDSGSKSSSQECPSTSGVGGNRKDGSGMPSIAAPEKAVPQHLLEAESYPLLPPHDVGCGTKASSSGGHCPHTTSTPSRQDCPGAVAVGEIQDPMHHAICNSPQGCSLEQAKQHATGSSSDAALTRVHEKRQLEIPVAKGRKLVKLGDFSCQREIHGAKMASTRCDNAHVVQQSCSVSNAGDGCREEKPQCVTLHSERRGSMSGCSVPDVQQNEGAVALQNVAEGSCVAAFLRQAAEKNKVSELIEGILPGLPLSLRVQGLETAQEGESSKGLVLPESPVTPPGDARSCPEEKLPFYIDHDLPRPNVSGGCNCPFTPGVHFCAGIPVKEEPTVDGVVGRVEDSSVGDQGVGDMLVKVEDGKETPHTQLKPLKSSMDGLVIPQALPVSKEVSMPVAEEGQSAREQQCHLPPHLRSLPQNSCSSLPSNLVPNSWGFGEGAPASEVKWGPVEHGQQDTQKQKLQAQKVEVQSNAGKLSDIPQSSFSNEGSRLQELQKMGWGLSVPHLVLRKTYQGARSSAHPDSLQDTCCGSPSIQSVPHQDCSEMPLGDGARVEVCMDSEEKYKPKLRESTEAQQESMQVLAQFPGSQEGELVGDQREEALKFPCDRIDGQSEKGSGGQKGQLQGSLTGAVKSCLQPKSRDPEGKGCWPRTSSLAGKQVPKWWAQRQAKPSTSNGDDSRLGATPWETMPNKKLETWSAQGNRGWKNDAMDSSSDDEGFRFPQPQGSRRQSPSRSPKEPRSDSLMIRRGNRMRDSIRTRPQSPEEHRKDAFVPRREKRSKDRRRSRSRSPKECRSGTTTFRSGGGSKDDKKQRNSSVTCKRCGDENVGAQPRPSGMSLHKRRSRYR